MFHERWRSFVPRLAPFPARPPSVSSLSKSIIPRFRREPDALLPAEIRRWWWLIVPPLSRDNEIFVCAMRPPVRPSLLIRHLDPPLPLSLSLRWIYSATIYTNWCILASLKCFGVTGTGEIKFGIKFDVTTSGVSLEKWENTGINESVRCNVDFQEERIERDDL